MIHMITGERDYKTQVGELTEEEARLIVTLRKDRETQQKRQDFKNHNELLGIIKALRERAEEQGATVNFTFETDEGTVYPYLFQMKEVYIKTGSVHKTTTFSKEA